MAGFISNQFKVMKKTNKQEKIQSKEPISKTEGLIRSSINLDFFKLKIKKKTASRSVDWSNRIPFIYPLTIFIIVIFLTWFMNFLYNNVYLTLSQAIELTGLRAKVGVERINQPLFEKIASQIDYKKTLAGRPAYACSINPLSYGFDAACLTLPKPTSTASVTTTSTTSIATSTASTTLPN
jgi:hypothetical protein